MVCGKIKNFAFCNFFPVRLRPSFPKQFVFWWFSVQISKTLCFVKVSGTAVLKTFFRGERSKEPQKTLQRSGWTSSSRQSLHPWVLDSSQKIHRNFCKRAQEILLRLWLAHAASADLSRTPETRPISQKLNFLCCWHCLGEFWKILRFFCCWSCSVRSGKLLLLLDVFPVLFRIPLLSLPQLPRPWVLKSFTLALTSLRGHRRTTSLAKKREPRALLSWVGLSVSFDFCYCLNIVGFPGWGLSFILFLLCV